MVEVVEEERAHELRSAAAAHYFGAPVLLPPLTPLLSHPEYREHREAAPSGLEDRQVGAAQRNFDRNDLRVKLVARATDLSHMLASALLRRHHPSLPLRESTRRQQAAGRAAPAPQCSAPGRRHHRGWTTRASNGPPALFITADRLFTLRQPPRGTGHWRRNTTQCVAQCPWVAKATSCGSERGGAREDG